MVKITATLFWRGLRRGARRHGPRLGLRTWLRQRISVGRGRQGAKRALVQLRAGGQQSRQALQALLRQNGRTILRVVGRWCLRRIWVLLTGGLHLLWILGLLSIRRACALYCGGRKAARAFGQGVRAGRRALRRSWRPVRQEWSWRCQQRRARQEMVMRLVAAYRQFDTAGANYLVPRRLFDTTARRLVQGRWSRGVRQSRHFLTSDVLSRTWYLPQETALELPGLEQKRARTLLIPTCLIAPVGYRIVGTSIHAGYAHPFAYLPEFLRQHTLIAGKTGEGKSTVLVSIARAAMEAGEGVCLLDPHGDLALDCLLEVPPQRHDDVVYIDLGEKEFSIGLNPLDVTLGRERDLVVAALVGTFQHLWEDGWGTRMEAPFRAALMTLYEANVALVGEDRADEQYTLLDVFQLLLDEGFCQQLLERVQDFYLHRFWYTYFQTLDVRQWRERIDPVLTKMLQFEAYSARRILGQGRSTLNLNEMIAERKILIVRLAAGEVGLAAPLIGATFLGLLMVALREQGTRPVDERARMAIIIDEFQILAGADYSLLLAELRKFGAAATLGTQSFEYLNKLDPHLLPTALANVKQFLIFRTSAQDARLICREIDVDDADIVNQDSYSCYVRLIYQGVQQPTFSLRLAPPRQTPQPDTVERFRLHSQRYTRRAADIEETLKAALARTLGMGGETGPVALTRPARGNRSAAAPIIEGTVSTQSLPTHAAGAEQTPPPPAAATAPSTTPQQSAPASDPRTSTHFGKKPRHGPFGKKGDLSSFDVYPVCKECTSEKMSEREGDL